MGDDRHQRTVGHYAIIERLASGGMATVYRAEALGGPAEGRVVALKILHEHLAEDGDFIRMFRDEGRVAKLFEHRNVVRVFDIGEADGQQFIAMELVESRFRHLADLLDHYAERGRAFPSSAAYDVLRQLLAALIYVHGFRGRGGRKLDVVHRDISPHNVLIDDEGIVKLTDFGIARGMHRSDRTRTGTVKGKMHYMAPEQAAGRRVDARADLYALGAVAYELFAGEPLFGSESTQVLQLKVMRGQIAFGRTFDGLHRELQGFLRKALAVQPEDRFQSAEAMLAGLERLGKVAKARFKQDALKRALTARNKAPRKKKPVQPELLPQEPDSRISDPHADAGDVPMSSSQRVRAVRMSRVHAASGRSHTDLPVASRQDRLSPHEHSTGRWSPPDTDAARRLQADAAAQPVDAEDAVGLRRLAAERTRAALEERAGLASATFVASLCAALLLFGTYLEVGAVHFDLPRVDERTFEPLPGQLLAAARGGVSAIGNGARRVRGLFAETPEDAPTDDGPGDQTRSLARARRGVELRSADGHNAAVGDPGSDDSAEADEPTRPRAVRNDRFLPRIKAEPAGRRPTRKRADKPPRAR